MKKNNAMRLASVLLVLTLLTTCVISGTFAKYTTSTTGGDKARVAYWGFGQAAATTIDLFDGQYANVTASGEVDGFGNVVAPGTEKSTTFAFAYTDYKTNAITAPEVAYTFTVNPTVTGDYDELDKNANFKWILKADHWPSGIECKTVAELLDAIKQLSGDESGTKTYAPGTLPYDFAFADDIYHIGWIWNFSKDAAGDAADTAMGNSQTLENVTFTITITATQVD